jgi:vacuolar protein sorting-associated protein 18
VKDLKNELWQFIKSNGKDIDQDTIFQMLQSHGKIKECIHFAEAVGCYQKLIVHYINKQEFLKALEKIESIQDNEVQQAQMLKYASILLKHVPIDTLETL